MARTTLTLTVEMELINDACQDMDLIADALPKKHGAKYRDLDRRMMDLEGGNLTPVPHDLGEGRIVLAPPVQIAAIIRDARSLGVI
jgi:hypothetical protein